MAPLNPNLAQAKCTNIIGRAAPPRKDNVIVPTKLSRILNSA
jgi:hypothetical protein